ncbi:hypothetical protein BE11_26145 [Sorangium cellulosum]|nr:hypothetical protein BE11_26145 [Sorangium cellulosum]
MTTSPIREDGHGPSKPLLPTGLRADFPIEKRDVLAQSECFPPELVRAAGRAGIGLELTIYLCMEDET